MSNPPRDPLILPPGYCIRPGNLRSGKAPGRDFYWRLSVQVNDDYPHIAIVREGQENSESERDRAMAEACKDIRRQERFR